MTSMQHRLLSRLHRVFDRTPEAVLALRLRSPGGLRWTVGGDALTIQRPARPDLVVPLTGATIGRVRAELAAADVEIAYSDTDLDAIGAIALLPGSGDQDASNGDHVLAYTSVLWGWTDALGRVLDVTKADIGTALKQLAVPTASGEWLDLWGSYFGILRRNGEADAPLAERIILEPRRPRSNPVAMRANIKRATGADVQAREPWREMMTLGRSRLGGSDRLPDGREFCYHTLQFVSPEFQDWDAVMREAALDRPAGTLLIPPVTLPPPFPVVVNAGTGIAFAGEDLYSWRIRDFDGHILGYNFYPSGTFRRKNPQFAIYDVLSAHGGELAAPINLSSRRTICRGEIVLSDQAPLGSVQAHLPGRMRRERGAPMRLSHSGRLSDYEWALDRLPILEWVTERIPTSTSAPDYPLPPAISPETVHSGSFPSLPDQPPMGDETTLHLATPRMYGADWTGSWDGRAWGKGAYREPVLSVPTVTTLTTIALTTQAGAQITEPYGNPMLIEVAI